MKKRVALIHTSFVFFDREPLLFDLFDEILPEVERLNIVDDQMLAEVMEKASIDPQITRRMSHYVLAAQAAGVDAIFNTCSSLGPAFDVAKELVSIPCVKIDDGMAELAAKEAKKIAVLATVPTTLPPTAALIQEKADQLGTKIELQRFLCEGAFDLLMKGEKDRHDDMVSEKALESAEWADTLVLAQCSMARLAPRLSKETHRPVLSSPRLGVERLKAILER
jgi:Asp/Glu/hydantoin racemase